MPRNPSIDYLCSLHESPPSFPDEDAPEPEPFDDATFDEFTPDEQARLDDAAEAAWTKERDQREK